MTTKVKSSLFLAVWILMSLVVALALGEVLVRLAFPKHLWQFRVAQDDWVLDERLGWTQKPSLDVTTRDRLFTVRFQTNPDGIYPVTARREKSPGSVRLMLFGDSTVVGRAVPQDQTLAAFLERRLRQHGLPAEVLCAGVQGYSTDQSLLRMQQLAPLYHPDILIHVVCQNDMGGNEQSNAYGFPKPRFQLGSDGALREIPTPPRTTFSRKATTRLSARSLVQHSAVYRLCQPFLSSFRARLDWRNRNLAGLDSEDMYRHPEVLQQFDWSLFGALIHQMHATARAHGGRFLFYPHPSVKEVWGTPGPRFDRHAFEKYLAQVADKTQTSFCPVIDHFMTNQHRGPFHLLPTDTHCNPKGYEVTAERLVQYLLENELLPRPLRP